MLILYYFLISSYYVTYTTKPVIEFHQLKAVNPMYTSPPETYTYYRCIWKDNKLYAVSFVKNHFIEWTTKVVYDSKGPIRYLHYNYKGELIRYDILKVRNGRVEEVKMLTPTAFPYIIGNASRIKYIFYSSGKVKGKYFFTYDNKPAVDQYNVHAYLYGYNSQGLVKAIVRLDLTKHLLKTSYAIERLTYNSWGGLTKVAYFDYTGRLVKGPEGSAYVEYIYDSKRRIKAIMYKDAKGYLIRKGIAIRLYKYYPNGYLKEKLNLDYKGRLVTDGNGVAKVIWKYKDNWGRFEYLDPSGHLVEVNGVAYVEFKFSKNGLIISQTFYSKNGKVVKVFTSKKKLSSSDKKVIPRLDQNVINKLPKSPPLKVLRAYLDAWQVGRTDIMYYLTDLKTYYVEFVNSIRKLPFKLIEYEVSSIRVNKDTAEAIVYLTVSYGGQTTKLLRQIPLYKKDGRWVVGIRNTKM